jgi:hypothetical protein
MSLSQQTIILFLLNVLDGILTIIWVRNGFATEGNQLMSTLLDLGNAPFLAVKIAMGAVTAFVLWRWRHFRLAKYGLAVVLMVYVGLMAVHFMTGLSAAGLLSDHLLKDFGDLTQSIFA